MLKILVGTMTGTAVMVAEALRDCVVQRGGAAEILQMDELDASVFEPGGRYMICSSTYGQGDVPDNAQAFFEKLAAERPDLSAVRYGVIALGDMTYAQTFCYGGKRFDRLLGELGALRLGEPLLHDASAGTLPEDVAVEWFETWLAEHGVQPCVTA